MHVRMPMLSLSLLTLSSLAVAAPQDSNDVSSESWSPPRSSYALSLPERSDVLRVGTLKFDSEIVVNTSGTMPEPSLNLIAKRKPTEEEKATDLERGEEVRAFTSLGTYRISRATIRSALQWLAPEESLLEWANQADLPSGSVLSGSVRTTSRGSQRAAVRSRGGAFLRVEVVFENGEAKRTVEFVGSELTDKQVEEIVAYLKATDKELEAIKGRI